MTMIWTFPIASAAVSSYLCFVHVVLLAAAICIGFRCVTSVVVRPVLLRMREESFFCVTMFYELLFLLLHHPCQFL